MESSTIKAMLISTVVTLVALFLIASVPIALDFSLSRSPILWNSFLSWLKPPYLFFFINVIITIIIASSSYLDREEDEILRGGDYEVIQTEQIVHQSPRRGLEIKDEDADFESVTAFPQPILISEVVYEEKEEEISGLNNGEDESVVLKSEINQVPSMMEESNLLCTGEKPPVSVRSGHRKSVKACPKDGKKRKALRVAKPKRQETTLENTWKLIPEEGKPTPLTSQYRRPDTIGVGAGEAKPVLRKSVTFRDMTNYQKSSTVTPLVKKHEEMSPCRDELNRRVEAFIKKCKEARLESMKLDKEVVYMRDLS